LGNHKTHGLHSWSTYEGDLQSVSSIMKRSKRAERGQFRIGTENN